jgi:hypothetical protein
VYSFGQNDFTSETQFNLSAFRKVSGNEQSVVNNQPAIQIPSELMNKYNAACDKGDENMKKYFSSQIEQYLEKSGSSDIPQGMTIVKEHEFSGDWYNSDVQVTSGDVSFSSSFRQIDLKQGEDGLMYMAVNRRNVPNSSGYISVYKSSDGGATWLGVVSITVNPGYYGSVSMLVESRNNTIADSTRILLYYTYSSSSNFDNASLYCASFRSNGSAAYIIHVASPSAGNRFVSPTACSDGMFFQSSTYMHAVVREETNAGGIVSLRHFRSTDWGVTHTSAEIFTASDDRYPVCAYSNETGTDSIYIAVERGISLTEHEIRLIATSETPLTSYTIRYITDAAPGTMYERPSITIQQRHFSLPQRILVTCTKNNRAVYHFSSDGGAVWTIDASLGLTTQQVDYTYCSSDSLAAGDKDFIAAFVDLNGDSITVRHGDLGAMGTYQHKRNSNQSSGLLAPAAAIYKVGGNKYSAFCYAGFGPTGVYYNMETLVTGITPVNSEIPSAFKLEQNYPNPFNPVTNIRFSLPKAGMVSMKIFDISGREVAELISGTMNAGTYNYDFNASNLSSGIYFYRINAEGFTDTKKMILVK